MSYERRTEERVRSFGRFASRSVSIPESLRRYRGTGELYGNGSGGRNWEAIGWELREKFREKVPSKREERSVEVCLSAFFGELFRSFAELLRAFLCLRRDFRPFESRKSSLSPGRTTLTRESRAKRFPWFSALSSRRARFSKQIISRIRAPFVEELYTYDLIKIFPFAIKAID